MLVQLAVEQGRKVVVFSQWRRMLRLAHWAVNGLLGGHGLRAAFFSGGENQRRRTRNLVEFHDDPGLRVLFATDAGGVGLNLQRASNCCVNLELPWNPAVLEQRIGRIYRLGQSQPIDVYNLVSRDCIEERIAGLVSGKKALFEGLFDGTTDEVRFEQSESFLSNVARIVRPKAVAGAPPDDESSEDVEAAAREIEQTPDISDELDRPGAALVEMKSPKAPAMTLEPARFLSGVKIRRGSDGGLSIDAPPEAASSLATLFEELAGALRRAGGGDGESDVLPTRDRPRAAEDVENPATVERRS